MGIQGRDLPQEMLLRNLPLSEDLDFTLKSTEHLDEQFLVANLPGNCGVDLRAEWHRDSC